MAFVYAFICSIMKKKTPIANNCVLIIATGHIGNAILDIDCYTGNEKDFFERREKSLFIMFTNYVEYISNTCRCERL